LKKGNKYSKIISCDPDMYFRHNGWGGWGDWLGCSVDRFNSYNEAKEYVRKQSLKGVEQWFSYDKSLLSSLIPRYPYVVYKRRGGWVSWSDFLGTSRTYRRK
jgi:hypothetical protein